ncbi:MAG: general secretion pathway protein GspB [Deferrisomatales bacterium]|nr:general secretion pathway protein GspB [Deferrisomatales bacterium]
MSFILEALRKAQKEKERGRSPDLRAAVGAAVDGPGRRRTRWLWAAAALVLALNGLALGWVLRSRPGVPVPPSVALRAPEAVAPAPAPEIVEGPAIPPPPEARAEVAAPPASPARSLAAEARRRAPVRVPPTPAPGLEPSEGGPPPLASRPLPDAAPFPSPPAEEPLPVATETPFPSGPAEELAPSDPAPVRGAGEVPSAVAGPVPLLAELSPEVRQGLPQLDINGHVYGEDPAERFVFINWRVYREGERIGSSDGPVLERITPEGVLVDFGGLRARLTVLP